MMPDFVLSAEQVRVSMEGVHHAGKIGNAIPTAGHQVAASHELLRQLVIEADSYISHMHHRGSWPSETHEVESLIARLRKAER